jgi:three-Cys-motif partner protein
MPVKGTVPWDRDPHTAVKHDIYRSYLSKWFPILLSERGYPSATYAEGFAGPGVYKDGSAGSPIIALQALANTPELQSSDKITKFLFVDDDPRCTVRLRQEILDKFPSPPRPHALIPVNIADGTCAASFEPGLDSLDAWNQPILAVLDSWGNAPVPYPLIRRIAQNPSSEVIITFMPQHFVRFVNQMADSTDTVFGHDRSWRDVVNVSEPSQKKSFLLTAYRSMLNKAGFRFILDFELVTRKGESLYLIFGTNHRRGLEKMKESVWSVDQVAGVGYRDPRDEMQETLFDFTDPMLGPLERFLESELAKRGPLRVEQLREDTLFQTVYREQHVIPALTNLRAVGHVDCDRPKIQRASIVRATVAH